MTTMTVAITRAVVTAAGLLVVVTAVLVAAFRLDPVGLGLAGLAIASLSVPLVGAAATRAQRRNPVGWLLLLTGVSIPLAVAAYLYAHAADTGADLPGASWAGWLDAWPWTPALTLVPVLGLLLFPTGRPPSRGCVPTRPVTSITSTTKSSRWSRRSSASLPSLLRELCGQ